MAQAVRAGDEGHATMEDPTPTPSCIAREAAPCSCTQGQFTILSGILAHLVVLSLEVFWVDVTTKPN